MKYMGSKSKVWKGIAPIIQKYVDESKSGVYIEAFCGGCNMLEHIEANTRLAFDKNMYLIALLSNLDKLDSLPDMVTREHYSEVRDCYNKGLSDYEDWYIGAVGFLASYNGRFFDGGYSGISGDRNYYKESLNNLMVQRQHLRDVVFKCQSYEELEVDGAVIYCDPPYEGTKQYKSSKDFLHNHYWDWVREMSKKNIVLCSEEHAPDDFECVWEQEVKRTINTANKMAKVEKLFKLKK